MKKNMTWTLSIPLMLGTISSAAADDQTTAPTLWDDLDIALGAEFSYEPDYQGSDDYEIDVFPLVKITYKDWLYLDSLAAGAIWSLPSGFRLQTGISYEEGRGVWRK